jgi:hypothetical protein
MNPLFEFYEQVRISTTDMRKSHLNGKCGVVMGRTVTEEGDSWYYAVDIDGQAEGWCFYEGELEATGRRFTREDFYDGSSVRVTVDKNGRGSINKAEIDD